MRDTIYQKARDWPRPFYGRPDIDFAVTFILFEQGNMFGYYRQHMPALRLRQYGLCRVITDDEMDDERVNRAEVIVMARPHEDVSARSIDILKQAGRITVIDTDDHPHVLWQLGGDLFDTWTDQNIKNYEEAVRAADLITVSVPIMKKQLEQIGAKRVSVIDNMLDPSSGRWDHPCPPDDGRIRILWTAGFTHGNDADLIERPIKEVLKRYPQAVFRTVGYMPNWVRDIWPRQLEVYPTGGIVDYPASISNCDISLGPLEENEFNLYRSSVKAWEATCGGSVFVASDYGPYHDELRHRKTAMLCKTEQDWIDSLSELIEDADLRDRIWDRAAEEVLRNRSIDTGVHRFTNAWRRAIVQRYGIPQQGVPQRNLEVVGR